MADQNPSIDQDVKNAEQDIASGYISKDLADFSYLMEIIINYYFSKSGMTQDEEGEGWKVDSGIKDEIFPKEIDAQIRKAFIAKLSKHQ
jgi:hypothetical protein